MVREGFFGLGQELMFLMREKLFELDKRATTKNISLDFGFIWRGFRNMLKVSFGSEKGVFVLCR